MYKFLPLRARLLYAPARNTFSIRNKHILPYIASQGDIELLQHLIDHGIDVNTADHCGNTALHVASNNRNTSILKLLLDNNANPNLQNCKGNTPLHLATANGHIDIIRLLLNHGSDVNLPSGTNDTALWIAWIKFSENPRQYFEIIRLLISRSAIIEHLKLVDTNSQGFLQNKSLISEISSLNAFEQQCHAEIKQMKSFCVGSSGFSFFDMFVLKKDINTIARCANNLGIVEHMYKFDMYFSLIEEAVEEGKVRAKMLHGAVESMDEIFESNQDNRKESPISWLQLPPELKLMILENLSNNDLTKLQHTDEAEAGGAHAIYEGE
ncbi:ankyrin repeat domain-containing protein [Orientia tsutsugamushi]|uniref:Ankyrin repeat family protein n=2 Tax=Orientia tsutsugamushi str. TA716 TaxID=1359175 RepID=A0A0F3P082_ORITS|nr:ankyrin repeat domain-containing protein [Orientia tsutsugamushi]KJV73780.1 ankyrin repeat family protein [Orientia tsutsugamushi str. TA716]